jgi:hypothetical protein
VPFTIEKCSFAIEKPFIDMQSSYNVFTHFEKFIFIG